MYIAEQNKKSIFKTYLIYFICMALFCVVRILASSGWLNDVSTRIADVIATVIIQVLIMFAIPFLLYCVLIKVKPKSVFKTCNYNKINLTTLFIALGLGVLLFIINIIVSSLFNGIISFTGYQTPIFLGASEDLSYSFVYFLLDALLIAVLPALCEEFLHRGILLQGTKHSGFNKSIIISSILFGLLHFDINKVFYAFVLGLILGFVSVVSKNIWVPIIMHFVNNFLAVYLDYAQINGWFGSGFYSTINSWANSGALSVFLISLVTLVIVVALLIYLILQLYNQTIVKKVNNALNSIYKSEENLKNSSVVIMEQNIMIQNMLENSTMLNLNNEQMKSPIEMVMPKQKKLYKTKFKDNIFLISSLVLGGLVTLFTFIWGFI